MRGSLVATSGGRHSAPSRSTAILGVLMALVLAGACSSAADPSVTESGQVASVAPSGPAASASAAPRSDNPVEVVIDTDMGSDDVMAISYLAAHAAINIRALTVAGTGLVHCPAGVRNARGILARLGLANVPIACGRERRVPGSSFPEAWRTAADAGFGLAMPDIAPGPPQAAAVEVLHDAIAGAGHPVRVIELGPATNLADALAADASLVGSIESITMMGGALEARGNVAGSGVADDNTTAEWNVFADPIAWQAVLASGAPITIVPIDATDDLPVNGDAVMALQANRRTPAAELVADLLERNSDLFSSGQQFWDQLTAVAAVEGSVVKLETRNVRVELGPGPELGRLRVDGGGREARVAVSADPAAFRSAFIAGLNGARPPQTGPVAGSVLALVFDGKRCLGDQASTMALGSVELAIDNRSSIPVAGGLARLVDGVTADQLEIAIAHDPDKVKTLATVVASVEAKAGATETATGSIRDAGSYVAGCIVFGDSVSFFPARTFDVKP